MNRKNGVPQNVSVVGISFYDSCEVDSVAGDRRICEIVLQMVRSFHLLALPIFRLRNSGTH